MTYQPMNKGVAYWDMTPDEQQEYLGWIALVRSGPRDYGLTPISKTLDRISAKLEPPHASH